MTAPALLLTFGEPRPGFQKIWDIIHESGCAYRSYCNGNDDGHDLVTDVPFTLPGLAYCHGGPLIKARVAPAPDDRWGVFRYHHMQLYQAAMLAINPVPAATLQLTDVQIANLCAGIYAYAGAPAVAWTHFDDGKDGDGVCWAIVQTEAADVVIFRGSTTLEDWFRDFMAVPFAWCQSKIGAVHPGFYLGMSHVFAEVSALLRPNVPWIVAGHSLGAGRAAVLAALAAVA